MEELDCRVKTERLLVTVNHAYPDFEITMDVFLCHAPEGEFNFKEHVNHVWLKADELSRLDWAAADFKALPYIKDE